MADDEKQLITFCTASIELYARSIIDPSSVNEEWVQKEIPSFVSKLNKAKAANLGKILFCLELQYRNAALYERYLASKKHIEDAVDAIGFEASAIQEEPSNLPSFANLQNHMHRHADLAAQAMNFLKYYNSCFPLRHRMRFSSSKLLLSPICSYKMDDFEIDAANEYYLVQKQQLKWKVQARDRNQRTEATGPEMLVPSLFFFIHWLADDAESMQRLLNRSREALCTYICSLASSLRKALQQSNMSSADVHPERGIKLLENIPLETDGISRSAVLAIHDDFVAFAQLNGTDKAGKEKPAASAICSILSAVRTYLALPESVPDRSQLVLKRQLRIDGQVSEPTNEQLVHVEWKMQLVLNKCVTTTETTQFIPKQIDVDSFKQSEQELERKMVIQSVVDPVTDEEISLDQAVTQGIIDYSSGTYCDRSKGESMTIDEAIMRGLILVEFVAVNTGEEKHNSFGTITVVDPSSNTQVQFVIESVTDRTNGQSYEFDAAVERGLLIVDHGTYWDTTAKLAMSISDALDKGYVVGRKTE